MDSLQDELDAIHALEWDKQQSALEGLLWRLHEQCTDLRRELSWARSAPKF